MDRIAVAAVGWKPAMEIARRAVKEILFDAVDGWETQLNGTMLVGVKWQAMSDASRVAEGTELA